MEKQFSPGPWSYCGHKRGQCMCCQVWSTVADFNVATAHQDIEELGEIPMEQAKANARLIAAAPEMLAALELCKEEIKWMWENLWTPHTGDHFNRPANMVVEIDRVIGIALVGHPNSEREY